MSFKAKLHHCNIIDNQNRAQYAEIVESIMVAWTVVTSNDYKTQVETL